MERLLYIKIMFANRYRLLVAQKVINSVKERERCSQSMVLAKTKTAGDLIMGGV